MSLLPWTGAILPDRDPRRPSARPQEGVQGRQRRLGVTAAHADAEAVLGHRGQLGAVEVGRQQDDARVLHQRAAELARVAAEVAREADAPAVRALPREAVLPAGEEGVEDREIGLDEAAVAGTDRVPVA